ncbi:MAG: hypothetical protein IH983_01920 [Planctomycetes bacterium]|nr:hypothetical protein [Planctomycetota bacterium]
MTCSSKRPRSARRGRGIIIVLDVSRLMLGEDAKPNRLARAKQYIADLVDHLGHLPASLPRGHARGAP